MQEMIAERSGLAKHIAVTGHTIDWSGAERLVSYEENNREPKIKKAMNKLPQRSLMNMRLEEGIVSTNCEYREDSKKKTLGLKTAIH
ncbi:unnamed protein product [Protopolystoma xenopodis]|uniref:Uncharacterized protein n=1 Tax=Protopolystoma xenopodis TaxID=117903 RepID=A0A3S5AA19_9PLAT|nr:unnamed protein product [Protopolystoma xenopodis]